MKEQFLSIQTGPPFKRNILYTTVTFIFFAAILFIANKITVNNEMYYAILSFMNKCFFLARDVTYQLTNITWFSYLIWGVSWILLVMLFASTLNSKLKILIIVLIVGTVFYQNVSISDVELPSPYWRE